VAAATTPSQAEPQKSGRKWFVGLGALGVALAKFKWLLIPVLTKGKLLLLGLAQAKTFFSMALALGVYSTAYGWQFALGLVVSIYIHEMGHVAWLRHYGIAASAPMFIPGVGAFVRLHSNPADVGEDARIGLAGPVWGAGAVVAAVVLQMIFAEPIFGAIAHAGAFINLFNLLPVWQLDGGRAFRALTRGQRAIAAATLWLLAVIVGDGLLFVLAAAATLRAAMQAGAPEKRDDGVLATYLALAVGLTLLMLRSKLP
jgi:Zn-dependent protease